MNLIIACDPKGGIGYRNKLPWSHPIEGDLPRFKKLTDNKIVIMGKNTYDSLPIKPLPNRDNYVITSKPYDIPLNRFVYPTNNINTLKRFNENACIIGGAKVIESTWDLIKTVYLTKTFTEYTCDRYINLLYLEKYFKCIELEKFSDHEFLIYKRI